MPFHEPLRLRDHQRRPERPRRGVLPRPAARQAEHGREVDDWLQLLLALDESIIMVATTRTAETATTTTTIYAPPISLSGLLFIIIIIIIQTKISY